MGPKDLIDEWLTGEHCYPFDGTRNASGLISALESAGYCIVPLEPTKAMLDAMSDGYMDLGGMIAAYDCMLAARPKE